MTRRPRLYLAGPEVFLPDPIEAGRIKFALAADHGLEGVYPLDASLDLAGLDKHAQATLISGSNEDLMRSCDAAIANLMTGTGLLEHKAKQLVASANEAGGRDNITVLLAQAKRGFAKRSILSRMLGN